MVCQPPRRMTATTADGGETRAEAVALPENANAAKAYRAFQDVTQNQPVEARAVWVSIVE